MEVSDAMPEDIRLLHRSLSQILSLPSTESVAHPYQVVEQQDDENRFQLCCEGCSNMSSVGNDSSASSLSSVSPCHIYLNNSGTAMRFLTAFAAQRKGCSVILDGCDRLRQRPVGQLVDVLKSLGADIKYIGETGYLPLAINGKTLSRRQVTLIHPQSSQFVSALLLIGVEVATDSFSPYITMTRACIARAYEKATRQNPTGDQKSVDWNLLEPDWSAAAFWYEYVAIHGESVFFPDLSSDSLQGDRIVADIFRLLGVVTEYTPNGVVISRDSSRALPNSIKVDFSLCPDLYPAVALACERLSVELVAHGTDVLHLKESDRLLSVRQHTDAHDHRMSMALLMADYPVDDTACIAKSYPSFLSQYTRLHSRTI